MVHNYSRAGEHVSFYSNGHILSGVVQGTYGNLVLVATEQAGRAITEIVPTSAIRAV